MRKERKREREREINNREERLCGASVASKRRKKGRRRGEGRETSGKMRGKSRVGPGGRGGGGQSCGVSSLPLDVSINKKPGKQRNGENGSGRGWFPVPRSIV